MILDDLVQFFWKGTDLDYVRLHGRDETFRGLWQQVNDYMRTQPGYQAHRLHRTVADDARYRYANMTLG